MFVTDMFYYLINSKYIVPTTIMPTIHFLVKTVRKTADLQTELTLCIRKCLGVF